MPETMTVKPAKDLVLGDIILNNNVPEKITRLFNPYLYKKVGFITENRDRYILCEDSQIQLVS